MINKSKNHWYDGWFYDKYIAPYQDVTYVQILSMIEKGRRVIDIGCGTGRFIIKVADKAEEAIGIDLSLKNINYAKKLKSRRNIENVDFIHADALHISGLYKERFDYAIVSYVIHEIDISIRTMLINELRKIAKNIIIADFAIPQLLNKRGLLNRTVEFFAGRKHFSNFLSFSRAGGIQGLVNEMNLKIIEERKDTTKTSYIVKVE
ncbi:MAG: class I SAM-dependent methyltransferase [Ignavibacteria bacterium]|nr:class I SAM-dependent methyltransferase [Ignavibacteria bacterium]